MNSTNCVIGISGGSGSGKTSIVSAIRSMHPESELCILSQDNYYIPRDEQFVDQNGIRNFDLPTAIDLRRFTADLRKLMSGETLELKEYVFNNDLKEAQAIIYKPAPIILVEGLFIYHHEEMKALFDYTLFVDAPDDIRLIRRIRRDRLERNYPLDDVLYRFEYHVTPSFVKYILPHRSTCDMVINNHDSFNKGLDILSGFIQSKMVAINP